MAALTSGSWTITSKTGDLRRDMSYTDYVKRRSLKLSIASGTYPATGVVLPGYQSVGLRMRLDFYEFAQTPFSASGLNGASVSGPIFWQYLATANRLRPHKVLKASGSGSALNPIATTVNIGAQTFYLTAVGW